MNTQHQTANLHPLLPPRHLPLARSPPSLPKYSLRTHTSKPNKTNYKWRPPQLPLLRHVTRRHQMKDTTTASTRPRMCLSCAERWSACRRRTAAGHAVRRRCAGQPCGVAADAGLCSPGVCATSDAKEKGGDDWIDTYLRSNDCAAGTCCHYWCSQKRREANKENSLARPTVRSGEESTECKSKGAGSKSRMESLLSELSQPSPRPTARSLPRGLRRRRHARARGSGRKARSLRGAASRSVRHGIRRTTASVQTGRRRRGG